VLYAGLLAASLAAYLPVLAATTGPLWDDAGHLTAPALRSADGLWRTWFSLGATQQYYPVTHTAFWVQSHIWGDALRGYHIVNVMLHATSALLLVLILRRLAVSGAALAGVLFALHPVHVESVAWISELKNTLSGVFFFAAALAYLRFEDDRRRSNYLLASGLFVLAVLSKSVAVTLPVALVVIAWWRRGAINWRRDVLPLAPWVTAGVVAGLTTIWFEREGIGAHGAEYGFTMVERALIAGRAAWFYAASLVWPVNLSFNYPLWEVSQSVWWQYHYPVGVLATLVGLWWRGARGAFAASLCFLIVLAPALGFVNVYPFRFSFVADHFQYHASAALLALGAAVLTRLACRLGLAPVAAAVAALALAAGLGRATSAQAAHYVDAQTLYRATIAANPDSWLSHTNLAALLMSATPPDYRAAADHARAALRAKPDYDIARFNLAVSLQELGAFREAAEEYRVLLRQIGQDASIPRRIALVRRRLGNTLLAVGDTSAAIAELRQSIALSGEAADTHSDLGVALATARRPVEALQHFERAAQLEPNVARHHNNVGTARLQTGQFESAAAALREAVRLDPGFADAFHNLGVAEASRGRFAEAAAAFEAAVRLRPDDARSRAALAAVQARLK
jgi:tetratricopeptide (TPR) repeat protein